MAEATCLVTGGAGFIGSNFVHLLCEARPSWRLVNLDALTYAGNLENLTSVEAYPEYAFVHGDITVQDDVERAFEACGEGPLYVVHFAAESHVDRSIQSGLPFVQTNVSGTQVLLDAARGREVQRFLHVSTDEVYGSLGPTGAFSETSPLQPSSPYSASKTSADLIALAWHHTFGMDVVVTRCSNNYGSFQFPEKLIPLMVDNAFNDKPLPVYGDGANIRDWLHVEDHCAALLTALEKGRAGEVYNIGGNSERQNIQIVKRILQLTGKPESLIKYVKDRPGHDRRYAIDPTKIRTELGWAPLHTFEEGLEATVKWYLKNRAWVERVTTGAYRAYFETQYRARLS